MWIGLVLLLVAVIAVELAAVVFGADSRDGNDWLNHRPL